MWTTYVLWDDVLSWEPEVSLRKQSMMYAFNTHYFEQSQTHVTTSHMMLLLYKLPEAIWIIFKEIVLT